MAKRRRKTYVQDEVAATHRVVVHRPHVAQEYQDTKRSDVAYELTRHLTRKHRNAVIGNIVKPGEAYSS